MSELNEKELCESQIENLKEKLSNHINSFTIDHHGFNSINVKQITDYIEELEHERNTLHMHYIKSISTRDLTVIKKTFIIL